MPLWGRAGGVGRSHGGVEGGLDGGIDGGIDGGGLVDLVLGSEVARAGHQAFPPAVVKPAEPEPSAPS